MADVFAAEVTRTEDGGIPVESFLACCDKIEAVYDILFSGLIAGQLKVPSDL